MSQAYWDGYHHYGLWKPKCVFTIHNAEFGLDRVGMGAYYSQRFTTVSPSYAYEVLHSLIMRQSLTACMRCHAVPFAPPLHSLGTPMKATAGVLVVHAHLSTSGKSKSIFESTVGASRCLHNIKAQWSLLLYKHEFAPAALPQ